MNPVQKSKTWPFSKRALSIAESITVAVTAKASALKEQGIDIISLSAGEPDFDTPQNIKDAAIQAISEGRTKYSQPASGLPELKSSICNKLLRENELTYEPSQIIVTCGAKQTIFDAIVALINEGDEAIIPAPYWVSYADQIKLMGGNPIVVNTTTKTNFRMSIEQFQKALSSKTKLILFNNPCNPTGAVYTKSELQALAEAIAEAGIYVISDEIYEKLLYDDAKHFSLAALHPKLKKKTLLVNGVSKSYAMTGWRVGYGAGPHSLINLMTKIQSQETTGTSTISQYAAIEALSGPQESVRKMRWALQDRRNFTVKKLNEIPGITCQIPLGAFYVFPNVSAHYGKFSGKNKIQNDVDLCNYLLEKARVAGVPGSGFGASDHIRFSYTTPIEKLEQAMKRIQEAFSKLL